MGRRLLLVSAILSLILAFQNCTPFSRSDERKGVLEKGGDGYTGKVSYVHASLQNSCPDGSSEKSVIEYLNGRAFLTKENCQPVVPPRLLADPGFLPYNPGALFLGSLLFEPVDTPIWSSVACRGQSALLDPFGRRAFSDIQLFETGKMSPAGPIYSGHIKIGYFDSQGLLASSETVVINQALPDPTPELGRRAFLLHHDGAKTGELSRLDLLDSGAVLVFYSAKFESPLVVTGMACASHE